MAVVNELAAIPFGVLIGAPLNAAIEAQAKAALTTVEFIRTVGCKYDPAKPKDTGEIVNVTFIVTMGKEKLKLQVPLLAIVPIPFLRIENMDIHFKASLSQSMETKDSVSSSIAGSVTAGVSSSWFVKANVSSTISSKKDSTSSRDSRYAVEYTMDINVHAVQDDVPGGLGKVLNLLNESIERQMQHAITSKSEQETEEESDQAANT